jgi:hypothetical protein
LSYSLEASRGIPVAHQKLKSLGKEVLLGKERVSHHYDIKLP